MCLVFGIVYSVFEIFQCDDISIQMSFQIDKYEVWLCCPVRGVVISCFKLTSDCRTCYHHLLVAHQPCTTQVEYKIHKCTFENSLTKKIFLDFMLHLISVNSNVSHAPHCRIYQNTLLAKMSDSRFQKDYCPALKFKKLKGLKCQKTIDRSIPFS